MFKKVLVANCGAIACRIIRTLRRMGVGAVAIYSDADAESTHVAMADHAVCVGMAAVAGSYLAMHRIIEAALATGAQAIHPGYGFLSENAQFVEACEAAGLAFIGPTPQQMRVFGLKHTARALVTEAGVPLLPGTGLLADLDTALRQADIIGYPVMLKSSAGGGGIGMQMCRHADELSAAFDSVRRLAQSSFSDTGVFLERYITDARHIEVQIFGDGAGQVLALGKRDCLLQRPNQKVVEETPAPNLREEVRQALMDTPRTLASNAAYRSAGTVEFVVDAAMQEFFFLEGLGCDAGRACGSGSALAVAGRASACQRGLDGRCHIPCAASAAQCHAGYHALSLRTGASGGVRCAFERTSAEWSVDPARCQTGALSAQRALLQAVGLAGWAAPAAWHGAGGCGWRCH